MARYAAPLLLSSAILFLAVAQSLATQDVTLPNGITVASLSEPTQGTADLGDEPTISKPDQVFTATGNSGSISTGVDNGKPIIEPSRGSSGRKMLGSLELSGNGASVGDNTLGASTNAYGHGDLNGLSDTHIEPHGVATTVDAAGKSYSTSAGVDPDCVAKEGPCANVGRK